MVINHLLTGMILQVYTTLLFQICCEDRCLDSQTDISWGSAFKASFHLYTHKVWLEDGLDA